VHISAKKSSAGGNSFVDFCKKKMGKKLLICSKTNDQQNQQLEGLGSIESSPSGVSSEASQKTIWCIFKPKRAALVATVLWIIMPVSDQVIMFKYAYASSC